MSARTPTHRSEHTRSAPLDRIQDNVRDAIEQARAVPFLRGKMIRVAFTGGARKVVAHGLGTPAAFMVVRTNGAPFTQGDTIEQGVVERAKSVGTWTFLGTAAPGQTNGCRWTLKNRRAIVGVRFIWRTNGAAYAMTAKLWDDASGNVLASATVSVNATGIYEARFATPITANLVGKNVTTSVWNAAAMSYTTDTTWKGLVGLDTGPDLTLLNHGLYVTNDARPTSNAGAGVAYVVEPILAAAPSFAEHADQSGLDANRQIAIEAATTCTADLWLYPRGVEGTPV